MGRLVVLFTVSFLLFSFSHARFITVKPEPDVKPETTVADLPESNPKTTNTIHLPSKKRVNFKHGDDSDMHFGEETVPLTMVSFHPINRHFPRRPLIPLGHKHNCRFHKRFRPLNPRFQQNRIISYGDDMILSDKRPRFQQNRIISYGDDMILSDKRPRFQQNRIISYGDDMILSDNGPRFHPEPRNVVPHIQATWAKFPDDGTDSKEHVDFIKPHHHDHDHEDEHDLDHDDDNHHHHFHHQHGHEHKGGFMKRFRKFFNIHV